MRTSAVLFCAGLLLICAAVRGADPVAKENGAAAPAKAQPQSVVFGFPVAIRTDASKEMKDEAERLGKALGQSPPFVLQTNVNPICCIWIEFWAPNPSEDGYVVIIQPGGGRIIASSMAALKRAIDHVERVRSPKTGAVPIGVLTSYQVVRPDSTVTRKPEAAMIDIQNAVRSGKTEQLGALLSKNTLAKRNPTANGSQLRSVARWLTAVFPVAVQRVEVMGGDQALIVCHDRAGKEVKLSLVLESGAWKLDLADDLDAWKRFGEWIQKTDESMNRATPILGHDAPHK